MEFLMKKAGIFCSHLSKVVLMGKFSLIDYIHPGGFSLSKLRIMLRKDIAIRKRQEGIENDVL